MHVMRVDNTYKDQFPLHSHLDQKRGCCVYLTIFLRSTQGPTSEFY